MFSYHIFPKYYFGDAFTIIDNLFNLKSLDDGASFYINVLFYKYTFLKNLPFWLVALIQIPICLYLLNRIYFPKDFDKVTIANVLYIFSLFILALYLSMPTKEFLNFIFVYLMVQYLLKNKKTSSIILTGVAILIFSYFYRKYFILVYLIALISYIIAKNRWSQKLSHPYTNGIILAIILSLTLGFIKGSYMSQDRENLNMKRLKNVPEKANTVILSPVKTDTWYGESVSILYGFVTVNIPVNVVFKYSLKVAFFAIWQIVLFLYLLYVYSTYRNHLSNNDLFLFMFCFAYFVVQGIFEPDLGSAIRHKIGVFPLIYYLMYLPKIKNLSH